MSASSLSNRATSNCGNSVVNLDSDAELKYLAHQAAAALPSALYQRRGWGGVAWGFYGTILTYLEKVFNHPTYNPNGKHPVYACGYDWRKSNSISAQGLVDRVNTILTECPDAEQDILVTHSMGGLVARYACTQLGLNDKVMGVIHTVQPSNGAVMCYRRFATGCTAEVEPGGKDPINMILGDAWWKYTAYMSGLPGPVQLLPNERYSWNREPGCSDPNWLVEVDGPEIDLTAIYDVYLRDQFPGLLKDWNQLPDWGYQISFISEIWDEQIIANLARRVRQARDFHARLGTDAHPLTYVIYTNGEKTDERVEWRGSDLARIQTNTGDGTVPSNSGGCFDLSGVTSRTVFSGQSYLKHAEIFQNADIRRKVREHLNEILAP